jgi:hypothetical protein
LKRSLDLNTGVYDEALLTCQEGDLPDNLLDMLAA